MEKIGIIGAMDYEISSYLLDLKDANITDKIGCKFYSGILNNRNVVIVKSGIGKVNSAICSQILIDGFDVNCIVFTGVAGALNENLDIHDIVISKDCVQHDVDATTMGFKRGQILYTDLFNFEASENLIDIAKECTTLLGFNSVVGRILTGDQFINDTNYANKIKTELNGDCVDMESAAVGQVCHLNNIPFVIIRSISDKADHSSHVDFPVFCKEAAIKSHKLVMEILNKL